MRERVAQAARLFGEHDPAAHEAPSRCAYGRTMLRIVQNKRVSEACPSDLTQPEWSTAVNKKGRRVWAPFLPLRHAILHDLFLRD